MHNDQIPSQSDASTSNQDSSKSHSPATSESAGTEKDEQEPKQHITDSNQSEKRTMNIFIRFWEWIRVGTLPEWITVLITAVIAVIGGLQLGVYRAQKKIMESSGQQTDQLISAANIQAQAARDNVVSAQSMATSADKQAGDVQKQAQEMVTLANVAVGAAKQAYGAKVAPSKYMALLRSVKKQRMWVRISVQNGGKGDALSVSVAANFDFLPSRPKINPTDFILTVPDTLPMFVFDPKLSWWQCPPTLCGTYESRDTWKNSSIERYDDGRKLYVWGQIRYTDLTRVMETAQFCRYAPDKIIWEPVRQNPDNESYVGPFVECE